LAINTHKNHTNGSKTAHEIALEGPLTEHLALCVSPLELTNSVEPRLFAAAKVTILYLRILV